MVLRDLIRDVFQTLWAHKLRTALTMFGIAWGVISIVLMVAAGEGLRVGQAKVSQNFGRDLMIIFAGRTSLQAGGTRAGRRIEFEVRRHFRQGDIHLRVSAMAVMGSAISLLIGGELSSKFEDTSGRATFTCASRQWR